MDVERLKARADEIAKREAGRLLERTPASKALFERAVRSMPRGVPTTTSVSPSASSCAGPGAGIGSSPRTTATIDTPVRVLACVSPIVPEL